MPFIVLVIRGEKSSVVGGQKLKWTAYSNRQTGWFGNLLEFLWEKSSSEALFTWIYIRLKFNVISVYYRWGWSCLGVIVIR